MKSTNRFHELDAFRGLAALGVLLYHYSVRFEKLYPYTFHNDFDFNFGYLGVEWFFIISGFVIYYTISKTAHRFFFSKAFYKVNPTYWLSLLFSFFLPLI
jgi:peptidoglycan/LPS O-acetylase OafA/YrhL